MKLLFMTNVPSPYRVDFFNELGKTCNLTVTFEKKTSAERGTSWSTAKFVNFKGIYLKGISTNTDTAICPTILKYVSDRSFDKIICADFSSPTGIISILYMRTMKIKYWLESDGGFAKNGRGLKEKLKKWLISGADAYLSTGEVNDKYFIAYGANSRRIFRYSFTSLFEREILKRTPSFNEKMILRKKLHLNEKKIIISVGRFSYLGGYGKGFDTLLKVATKVPDVGIYIIGDSPTEEFINLKQKLHADNVHFIDFKIKEELFDYYRAADLFVLMTRGDVWGLVINEAMANGLPVITTDKCGAGIELIKNNENGFLVSAGDDRTLENQILEILRDDIRQKVMSEKSLEAIRPYTIENIVTEHMRAFTEAFSDRNWKDNNGENDN